MHDIVYSGEHLWAGQLGHSLVGLLIASALACTLSYFLSKKEESLLSYARFFLYTHFISVVGLMVLIVYMLFHHFFEYQYVWQHSNRAMDMQFIFSCLWEGQEGSFLLWIFWQSLLSIFLYKRLQQAEPFMMGMYMLVQTFLSTMIAGVYVGDVKIGSSMFLLLREHPDFMNLPFLQNPDYLANLDGRGLNPLLANYWMTIHPPTLFLGFASTLVPFVFALYGLYSKNYYGWQKQALVWTFFSVLILGAGILMGGAWAYEALSFGGFWAWDPVENSSLVPWLLMVAASHTMILNSKHKGTFFTTHLFAIAGFILVLYSTFLTRSGILGNASVHAFTDLGMQGQLLLFILFFIGVAVWMFLQELLLKNFYWMTSALMLYFSVITGQVKLYLILWTLFSAGLLIYAYVKYYMQKDEESLSSKEFWMFIGSLLLFMAGIIIIYFTSVPVFNKIFNTNNAPVKPEEYNTWMIPVASLIFLVTGFTQYLKYNQTEYYSVKKHLVSDIIISLVLAGIVSVMIYWNDVNISVTNKWMYFILMFFSVYAIVANVHYWWSITKRHLKKLSSALAHSGFALLILGALISTSKKYNLVPVSLSSLSNQLGDSFDKQKSIVLTEGDTVQAGRVLLQYAGKEKKGYTYYFKVNYFQKDGVHPKYWFSLYPRVQDNPIMGKAADPDTKHFLWYDLYTHITYADLSADAPANRKDESLVNYKGHLHDTIFANKVFIVLDSLYANKSYQEFSANPDALEITLRLKVINATGKVRYAYPRYFIKNKTVVPTTERVSELGMSFTIWKLYPDTEEIELAVTEKNTAKDFIVMEVSVFPMINLLWLGSVLMCAGLLLYIIQHLKKNE